MSEATSASTFLFLIFGYILPLLYLSLRKSYRQTVSQTSGKGEYKFSILIPYRNEANRIRPCLEALSKLNYPSELYEVIFINDHSEDESKEVVNEWIASSDANCKNLDLIKSKEGKKAAIVEGVHQAIWACIITLDADCEIQPQWLLSYNYFMKLHPKAVLIAGPVMSKRNSSVLSVLESIDFAAMVSFAALSFSINRPTIANGANLMFRKKAFLNSFNSLESSKTPSGDDVFLLHALKKSNKDELYYLNHKQGLVFTDSEVEWKNFLSQKLRWASKGKFYKDLFTIIASFWLFLVQLASLCLIFHLFLGKPDQILVVSAIFTCKIIAEIFYLHPLLKMSRRELLIIGIIPFQIIYPLYIIGIAILAQFLPYRWKGRSYKH